MGINERPLLKREVWAGVRIVLAERFNTSPLPVPVVERGPGSLKTGAR